MVERKRIWLTRPLKDSEALATELATHGIDTILAPVMEITPQPVTITGDAPTALLLTSRHAAHVLATLPVAWRSLPVYCVGGATAAAATAQGFGHCIASDAEILALLPRIAQQLPAGSRVLYLSGDEVRVDVPALLATHNIHAERYIAYDATAVTQLPADLCAALVAGEISSVALFSPRSASLVCSLLQQHGLAAAAKQIDACCLSLNVAQAAAALPWAALRTCHLPTRAAMVDLMVSPREKTL